MEKKGTTAHLGHLDGLRALAALYVMLCHALLQVNFRGAPLGNGARFFLSCFFFGHYAVDLFIVLSGFCLMLPIVRGDGTLPGGAWRFLKRRAWRIIPPYYGAVALSLALIAALIHEKTGTHWDISLPVTGKSILTHLLLVQDATGDEASINHVFWSISVEWRIYFLFPTLVFLWARFGSATVSAAAVILSYLTFNWCLMHLGNGLAAHYVGLFAMGMLGANAAFPGDKVSSALARLPWGLLAGSLTMVVALMFFPRLWDGPLTRVYIADYVVGAWSVCVLVASTIHREGRLARTLGCRPLAFVGTFAYSLYLIHAPLLQVLWQYPFATLHARPLLLLGALTFVGGPLIVGAAYVFFLAFERPFLRTSARPTLPTLAVTASFQPAPEGL